ncbi:MAG TPA: peptide chain release factor N(5)-glutamine methyltransferase [Eudoraea sp.]|nr:peptide chain release factor N(5)-glutamine methyltransferase [Eudoraea sp.]
MLLREVLNIFKSELEGIYPKEEVTSIFHILLEHYLGLERFVLVLRPGLAISKVEEQPLFEALAQLKLERPVQYIVGETSFMELKFNVDEHVLIPRPETEELVQWIISEFKSGTSALRILDIGTGSGCIAVTLAKNLPVAEVFALDISQEILRVAKSNALRNGVNIACIEGDIFTWHGVDEKFDIIVSNPPYVRELEKQLMRNNVKKYEPETALFVSDEAPLQFYEQIVFMAKNNLAGAGALFLEINQYLGKETRQLLEDQNFSEIELRKDIFGHDRMLKGVFRNII